MYGYTEERELTQPEVLLIFTVRDNLLLLVNNAGHILNYFDNTVLYDHQLGLAKLKIILLPASIFKIK